LIFIAPPDVQNIASDGKTISATNRAAAHVAHR